MSCKALTTKGTPCTRERMNDTIPYCWQHSRRLLEKLMWGLDEMRDDEGELTPDDLTPEQVIEQFNNCSRRVKELTDALAECTEDRRILERALDDCEEELDGDSELPLDDDLSEEDDPIDSGTFPDDDGETDDDGTDEPVGVPDHTGLGDIDDVFKDGLTDEQMFNIEPKGSAGLFHCTEEEAGSMSGNYSTIRKRKDLLGDAGTLARNPYISGTNQNFLNEYFLTYGSDDAWDYRGPAYQEWVKSGDWFFFRNSLDDKWYGSRIKETEFLDYPNGAVTRLVLEEMDMANLGVGVEFVIIVFKFDWSEHYA